MNMGLQLFRYLAKLKDATRREMAQIPDKICFIER